MTKDRFGSLLDDWEKKNPVVDKDAPRPGRVPRAEKPASVTIDLHGKSRQDALRTLEEFFANRKKGGPATVVIIHGVGRHSEDNRKILKPAVKEWLSRRPELFSLVRPGRTGEGGTGVTVVVMKKTL
jgi:DNA-nicking Smr family endonuclease